METAGGFIQLKKPETLDDLIEELHKVFSTDRVNIEQVKALLSAYRSDPKDWKKFAKFDTHRYTRNLIDRGNGKFNLMALCWGEGHGSSIHDHANSHCFVKVLDGDLKETMFEWPSDSEEETHMKQRDIHHVTKDDVTYINDDMGLHRVENPSHTDTAVSMHLYIPPFEECCTFDERSGKKREVKVTFYSQYGDRTPFGKQNYCAAGGHCVEEPENN